jgi:hypothetical protein
MADETAHSAARKTFNALVRGHIAFLRHNYVINRQPLGVFADRDYGDCLFILGTEPDEDDVTGDNIIRINMNELNAWRNAAGNLGQHADTPNAANMTAIFTNGIGIVPARSMQTSNLVNYEPSPTGLMRNEEEQKSNEADLPDFDAALPLRRNKSFYWRSVYNIADHGTHLNTVAAPALGNVFWTGGDTKLYLPCKVADKQAQYAMMSETVTSVEPFFGYSTGCAQLRCDHPLDTARLGRHFPPVIQDYHYTMSRDWSKLFKKGYIHDPGCTIRVTPQPTQFKTVSILDDSFTQQHKSVSTIGESSHTIDRYQQSFSVGETPSIKLETQRGQFEHIFMYVDFERVATDPVMPTSNPVITSFQYKVYGQDNLFVKELTRFDIERFSRNNCHELSNWRDMHEAGRGILLHLSDLGLTNETPFPFRDRIALEFKLLTSADPAAETINRESTSWRISGAPGEPPNQRRFTVALIRHNNILKGDTRSVRFEYLNEQR